MRVYVRLQACLPLENGLRRFQSHGNHWPALGQDPHALREELEKTRAALVRMHRLCAVGQVSAGLAHDLRNVLGGVSLQLGALARETQCTPSQKRALKGIERALRDSMETLQRLQDVARAQRPRAAASDLAKVISDAADLARAEPRVRIDLELPPKLPRVRGSAGELKHVFLNLLLNARDAMPKGGKVLVRAARKGRSVEVTVRDEGPGVPARHLPHIFEAFFTTKGRHGLGMGLTVAQSVMERLGGSIAVRNDKRGATFRLTVPLA